MKVKALTPDDYRKIRWAYKTFQEGKSSPYTSAQNVPKLLDECYRLMAENEQLKTQLSLLTDYCDNQES
jgi:hypothetical protein